MVLRLTIVDQRPYSSYMLSSIPRIPHCPLMKGGPSILPATNLDGWVSEREAKHGASLISTKTTLWVANF